MMRRIEFSVTTSAPGMAWARRLPSAASASNGGANGTSMRSRECARSEPPSPGAPTRSAQSGTFTGAVTGATSPAWMHGCTKVAVVQVVYAFCETVAELRHFAGGSVRRRLVDVSRPRNHCADARQLRHPGQRDLRGRITGCAWLGSD